jgi:hypothetical protein
MVVQRSLEVETESQTAKAPKALTTGTYETAPDFIRLRTDVFWSGALRNIDLVRLRDRVRVDERFLINGNADDVLHFDDLGEPIEWWPPIIDPSGLLEPWVAWGRSGRRELTTLSNTKNQGAFVAASVTGAQDTGVFAQHLARVSLGCSLETS